MVRILRTRLHIVKHKQQSKPFLKSKLVQLLSGLAQLFLQGTSSVTAILLIKQITHNFMLF
jgi:hypothetical protein